MTVNEWLPPRVVKIDRELADETRRLPELEREVSECKDRIESLKRARVEELSYEGKGAG